MTKIKICGLTTAEDIDIVNEYKPDYAGFVLFFPKSKRNISTESASKLLNKLDDSIKSVAVMVSPDAEQIALAENAGFDYLQIHGKITDEILDLCKIPVLRAFNGNDYKDVLRCENCSKIYGYVFDSALPGSGSMFDWQKLKKFTSSFQKRFFLAGGLNPENVKNAIENLSPYAVDVSSGVENDDGFGKDKEKIQKFILQARFVNGK